MVVAMALYLVASEIMYQGYHSSVNSMKIMNKIGVILSINPRLLNSQAEKPCAFIYLPNTVSLGSIELITTICLCPLGKTEPIWQGKWDSQSDIVTNVLPQLP